MLLPSTSCLDPGSLGDRVRRFVRSDNWQHRWLDAIVRDAGEIIDHGRAFAGRTRQDDVTLEVGHVEAVAVRRPTPRGVGSTVRAAIDKIRRPYDIAALSATAIGAGFRRARQ